MLSVAELPAFASLLLFECGVARTFLERCRGLLPKAEVTALESWRDVRHRFVVLDELVGHDRARLVDCDTGEVVDAVLRIELGAWYEGESALAVVVPSGADQVVVGNPIVLPAQVIDVLRREIDGADGPDAAAVVLRLVHDVERRWLAA